MSYSSLPFTSKLFQLTALTISLTLAGCGGGGGGDTVDSIAPTPDTGLVQVTPDGQIPGDSATKASEIYISSNYSGIKMTKGASIEVTALVLDANNGNLAEQPVTFKITDPKATGVFSNSQSKITTDENGKAVIRLEVLNQLSTEQSDYLINNGLIVEASIGNVTKSIKLYGSNDNADIEKQNVYDVFISSDKNQLLTGQDKTTVSIRVTDKKGGIIAGVPVIVSIADAALYGLSLNGTSRQLTDNEGLVEIELIQSRVSVDAQLNHESVLNVVVDDGKNSIVEQNLPIIASGTRVSNVVSSKNAVNAGDNFRVSGQLLDGAAKPVANADFIIYSNDTEAGVGKSDNNGNFAVDLNASSLKPVDDNYLFSLEVKALKLASVFLIF
ncbi:Ig-like domain-containing protein [Psychrobacter glacincola]|uniref:Ig-like domain-containing protein n=1 Tax=Psychrobacter glacincola TaxID=56810 RepID=UPI00191A9A1C|nr:Ig-like domain-containing protein [Psychrobacter glacincola]